MKRTALLLVLVLSCPAQAGKFKKVVGQTFPPVQVKDLLTGKTVDLSKDLNKEAVKGAVVVFTSYSCPVAKAYEGRLNELVEGYGKEFVFILLNANAATETKDQWGSYAKERKLKGTVAVDENATLAKKIGAGVTPEVYLLDKTGKILYHGPVDDSQDPKYIENHYLKEALQAVSSGGEIPPDNREPQAFGCSIKFPK